MKLLIAPRRGGKTTAMVEWVKEGSEQESYPFWSRVLVTITEKEAQRVREEYDLDYHQVFSAEDFQGARGFHASIAVDNADTILQHYLGQSINFVTITQEDGDE